MSPRSDATPEQHELALRLMLAAIDCPPASDEKAFQEFQDTVLEPIREQIRRAYA